MRFCPPKTPYPGWANLKVGGLSEKKKDELFVILSAFCLYILAWNRLILSSVII